MVWSAWFDLTPNEVDNEVPTTPGVFCVARRRNAIRYTAGESLTVLLGVAPDRQRGLRAVLGELARGGRGDFQNERREQGGLRFCFQANIGSGAEVLFQEIMTDFATRYGEAPRCNHGSDA
jgi:hypothetical protein